MDVRFAPGRILQPDVFVLFHKIPREHEGPIDRVPELCVEVLSSNRIYDRVTERMIYGAAGVSELWLVEASQMVERWCGDGLTQSEELLEAVRSPLLPGFELPLPALFRD